ncbi:MAG: GNAT family N-acetyltransferase [Pseudomonadota bacterium]
MTLARCTVPPIGAAAEAAVRHRAVLPVLETARLRLRAPAAADFTLWLRIGTEPGCEWIGGPAEPEDAWYDFCGHVACWLLHGHGPFVVERKADGTALGFVFLGYEWDDAETELGWFLAREARGQGYAREAAVAVRDWGLGLLPDFVSYVQAANGPSTRVAQSLGAVVDAAESARIGTTVWRHGAGVPA